MAQPTVYSTMTELQQKLRAGRRRGVQWQPDDEAELSALLRGEAETLLLSAAGWSRTQLLVSYHDPLPTDVVARVRDMVKRRNQGEPIQYITGEAAFYGRTFRVRPGCLIPRPETEVLVDSALSWIAQVNPAAEVLDFGTGSGALAITLALEAPTARVEGIDVSVDALTIARENGALLRAPVTWRLTDGIQWLRDKTEHRRPVCHLLVANPPYIPSHDVTMLTEEVRAFEPGLALDGGPDGLVFYRWLAAIGDGFFHSGPAAFWFEVGIGQADAVCELFAGPAWQAWSVTVVKDLRGVDRIVKGTCG